MILSTLLSIHWNVSPEFFSIGSISVRWYGLMFALGFLLGYQIMFKMFKFESSNTEWLDKLFIYTIVATIVGARLGHVFFYGWSYYSQHLIEIILPIAKGETGYKFVGYQGLASHGGAIGIVVAIYIFSKKVTKRSLLWTLDRLIIPTALVGAMIRTGNLMNSEIYGVATDMPWGFIFERNHETVAKHPTQIYEALGYLLLFISSMWIFFKAKDLKDRTGFIIGYGFAFMFLVRFLVEFIKEDQEAFEAGMALNMGQILSIPFILAGCYLMYRAMQNPPVKYKN
ncbi:MAG TPA: prolipoprotein diacylglyceryl transferase [Prolixibacteraceae bacterium]|nr:prolipoprotein diacylglyceryl transferase [Prolixibacteraceae bacterium]